MHPESTQIRPLHLNNLCSNSLRFLGCGILSPKRLECHNGELNFQVGIPAGAQSFSPLEGYAACVRYLYDHDILK